MLNSTFTLASWDIPKLSGSASKKSDTVLSKRELSVVGDILSKLQEQIEALIFCESQVLIEFNLPVRLHQLIQEALDWVSIYNTYCILGLLYHLSPFIDLWGKQIILDGLDSLRINFLLKDVSESDKFLEGNFSLAGMITNCIHHHTSSTLRPSNESSSKSWKFFIALDSHSKR